MLPVSSMCDEWEEMFMEMLALLALFVCVVATIFVGLIILYVYVSWWMLFIFALLIVLTIRAGVFLVRNTPVIDNAE